MWRVLVLLPFVLAQALDPETRGWYQQAGWIPGFAGITGLVLLAVSVGLGRLVEASPLGSAKGSLHLAGAMAAVLVAFWSVPQCFATWLVSHSVPGAVTSFSICAYAGLELFGLNSGGSTSRRSSQLVLAGLSATATVYAVSMMHADLHMWMWDSSPRVLTVLLQATFWLFALACVWYSTRPEVSSRRYSAVALLFLVSIGCLLLAPFLLFLPFLEGSSVLGILIVVPYVCGLMFIAELTDELRERRGMQPAG